MSGAEAVAIVGLVSNVLQFVDFTTKLCSRIQDCSSAVALPAKFAAQAERLSSLLTILGSLDSKTSSEPLDGPNLQKCQTLAAKLSSQLDSLTVDGQRRLQIFKKAFKSLRREGQLQEMQLALDGLVKTLSLQMQDDARSASKIVESNTESIVRCQYEHSAQLDALQRMTALSLRDNSIAVAPTKPVWMVPIGRNPDFVGREAILTNLSSRLVTKADIARSAALCGLGGVGKSQVALEYACRTRACLVNISVFWVHAGNTAQFVESYQRIAHECQVPGRDQAETDCLQLVKNWLETRCEYHWLMIVDNVDDHAMFFDTLTLHGKKLRQYMPQTPEGSILYTTRNRDIGVDLLPTRDPIYVSPMDNDEARALLGERVRSESAEVEQHELLNELLFLPLAISQAAAFMVRRRKSVSQYLEMYRESESTRLKLLGQRSTQHGRDNKLSESVLTTWWLSFEHIKRENTVAADLLKYMSFLARQRIPVSLLTLDGKDKFDIDEAIGLLESYSLVTSDATRSAYNVHRLVSIAVQSWLMGSEHPYESFAESALQVVASKYLSNSAPFGGGTTEAAYLPHVEAVLCASVSANSLGSMMAREYLHDLLSFYFLIQCAYKDSAIQAKESARLSELVYGRQDPRTLLRIDRYTLALSAGGHFEAVIALRRETFDSKRRIHGYRNLDTLNSLGLLGDALRFQGSFREAKEIYQRVLCETSVLLEQDPQDLTLQSALVDAQSAMAELYSDLHCWKQAEQGYRKVMDMVSDSHERDTALRGLARVLYNRGRDHEAKALYSDLLKRDLEDLGEQHPWTLNSLSTLAAIANNEGKHTEAERSLRHIYDISKATRGDGHTATKQTQMYLASTVAMQGRYSEAEELARRCLAATERFYGLRHPATISNRGFVGRILRGGGKYNDAYQMNVESLAAAEDLEEASESLQLDVLNDLVQVSEAQHQWKEAEYFRRQELKILAVWSDTDEADRQRRLISLAWLVSLQGRWRDTVQILGEVLDATSNIPGWDHEDTLTALGSVAEECLQHETFDIVEEVLQKKVDLELKLRETGNEVIMDDLDDLAYAQERQGKYAESERNRRQEWVMRTEMLGPEYYTTLQTVEDVANLLIKQDASSEEAASLLRGIYPTQRKKWGVDDEDTQCTVTLLAEVLTNMGNMEEAEVYRKQISASAENVEESEDDIATDGEE